MEQVNRQGLLYFLFVQKMQVQMSVEMEMVPARGLMEVLNSNSVSLEDQVKAISQLTEGVMKASPENMTKFLQIGGVAKVAEFLKPSYHEKLKVAI